MKILIAISENDYKKVNDDRPILFIDVYYLMKRIISNGVVITKDSVGENRNTTTIKTPAVDDCRDFMSHECNTCHGRFICINPKFCPCCGRLII